MNESDKVFAGSIPKLYDTYLVPLIFQPYADDLATRVAKRTISRVLEIAAGTGVVTRALASTLPETVKITATDLNQAMLDHGAAVGTKRPVEWRQADASARVTTPVPAAISSKRDTDRLASRAARSAAYGSKINGTRYVS